MGKWYAVIEGALYINEEAPKLAVRGQDGSFTFVDYTNSKGLQGGDAKGRWRMLLEMAQHPGNSYDYEKWHETVTGSKYAGVGSNAVQRSKGEMLSDLGYALGRVDSNVEIDAKFPILCSDGAYKLVGVEGTCAVEFEFDETGKCVDAAGSGHAADANAECVEKYLEGLSRLEIFTKIRTRSNALAQHAVTMSIDSYQHRRLFNQSGSPVKEASLLEFVGGVRVHYVVAEAGCGKTVLSQLLVQVALSQHFLSALSADTLEKVGATDARNGRAGMIPFYFSFNPPYGSPGVKLANAQEPLLRSFLEGLVYSYEAPLPYDIEDREGLIASLGDRAVFIVDALDEADDYGKAQNVLLQAMRAFPEAGLIVTSRRLASRPAFVLYNGQVRGDCDAVELLPLEAGDEQAEMLKGHLAAWLAREEVMDTDCVKSVLSNHYVSALLANPLFAAYVAQECTISDHAMTVDVHAACEEAVSSLLDKAASALNNSMRDSAVLLEATVLKRTLARISLALELDAAGAFETVQDGLFPVSIEGELAFLRDVANIAARGDGVPANDFCSAMVKVSKHDGIQRGFLSHSDTCRLAVVASGVVSYDPSCSACSFVNPVIRRYLAAWALVELLAHFPEDGHEALRRLLHHLSYDGARDVVVMCVSIAHNELSETGVGHRSQAVQLVAVNEMLKLECLLPQESKALSTLLDEIAERTFGNSHLAGYEIRAQVHPYRDMLRVVVSLLREEGSDAPARNR